MTLNSKPKTIIIAGPTASGKTRFSVELALATEAEIINADSMQIYRGMDIGTAKPTVEERKGIPHHLLDVVDPDEPFNAAAFRSMALPIAGEIGRRDRVNFVVGGTGLYIKALLGGLFSCPPADMELRNQLNQEWETLGPVRLYERLKRQDPASVSKIHPNDRIRVLRALEIMHLTHQLPSALIESHGFAEHVLTPLKIYLNREREDLYHRINKRCEAMVEAGLARETEGLLNKGYSSALKPMKAIGYRHMVRYLKGDWSMAEALEKLKRDTRRYAKRQVTWFKADPE